MSNVSVLGETLLSFISPHFLKFVQELNPGISRSILQSDLSELEQTLPNDFYELYEWRNGSLNGFPRPFNSGDILDFSPVELIVEEMKWELYGDAPPTYRGCRLLPFIKVDSDSVAITLGRNYFEEAHIIYINEVGDSYLYCDSITSMLTSTVECFASGAIAVDDQGNVEEDYYLSSEIWQRNNPYALAEAISELTSSIDVCTSEELIEDRDYSRGLDSLTSTLATLWRFRPAEAITVLQGNLVKLKEINSARGGGLYLTLDEWLEKVE
ncbi:hypothetical protein AB3R30_20185 [Leptolyngbyaceae cyanobacterium UHCC 1019]